MIVDSYLRLTKVTIHADERWRARRTFSPRGSRLYGLSSRDKKIAALISTQAT